MIGLCSDLGLDVVAEGIETRLQADTVHTAGCQYAQGHLFGKPVPMSVLSEKWKDRIHEHAPQVATGRCNRD